MKIGKALGIVGLTYAVGSTARGVFENFGGVVLLTGIGVIPILLFGLFDWPNYDDVIRSALGIIGLVCIAGVIGMAMAGHVGLALATVVFLSFVVQIFQPVVSGMLAWWDTPERRFERRMERACGYEYLYSPTDGYCHFDHEHHQDVTTNDLNGLGYTETMVPPDWDSTGPAEGALENIRRLKEQAAAAASAPPPHGFLASLSSRWVYWIGVPFTVWWTIRKLFGRLYKPQTDPDVERQIARYRRPGFHDPRQKEIERRMRDYCAGRTAKF